MRFARPTRHARDADVVIHASGIGRRASRPALALAGFEATVVEMSWYGDERRAAAARRGVPRRRLTLKSSQVGAVATRAARALGHARRMQLALPLLADPALDALITGESAFDELPAVHGAARGARHACTTPRATASLLADRDGQSQHVSASTVRDHFMIAHSFSGEVFGPAQRCTAPPTSSTSSSAAARSTPTASSSTSAARPTRLRDVLAELNFRNLDDEPAFRGRNTTTEFLARVIFERMVAAIAAGELGAARARLDELRVTLHESHVAWAAYEGALGADERARGTASTSSFPATSETPTGGYIYDREIIAGLTERGLQASPCTRSTRASRADARGAARGARARSQAWPTGRVVVIDGLALPGLDRLLADEARRLAFVALVHHPLALETGLEPAEARALRRPERRALASRSASITTSQWTARTLAADGVPISQLRVVEPGVDRRKSRGSRIRRDAATRRRRTTC